MSATLAQYEFRADGWHWIYELHPDRLVAIGVAGEERQHFECELKHAHDIPNHGVRTLGVRYPRPLWIAGAALFLLVVIICTTLAVSPIMRNLLPGRHDGPQLIALALGFLVLELAVIILLPHLLRTRNMQRFVTFKRISDGGELLSLHSEVNPADESFERFVEDVIEAIRAERSTSPPTDFSFRE